jgi:hypothetical protein
MDGSWPQTFQRSKLDWNGVGANTAEIKPDSFAIPQAVDS